MLLQHFMLFKPWWWVLHVIAIGFTLYLGHMVTF